MQKSLLRKYLVMTMTIVLASYILLASLMSYFFSDYWEKEKNKILTKNAINVSNFASNYVDYDLKTNKTTIDYDIEPLTVILDLISNSVEADIFITDLKGKKLIGTTINSEEINKSDFVVSEFMVKKAILGNFSSKGTLNGLYEKAHYTVAIPLVDNDKNGEVYPVGAVFASTNASEINESILSNLQIFLMAAVVTLLLTLVFVWIYTYRLVRPLSKMSQATKAFGNGDFSVRVPVETSDEIGQLAVALNNMANSLSNSEGIRRSFIANVSHELKTPMTTIGGFIDGILDGTIPKERQSQYLKIVSDEVKRLARLVKSMLDLSRIDSGEMKINLVNFDVTNTIVSTLLTFEQKIDQRNLDIQGIDLAGPVTMTGDQDLLHQVIYNLIENAVKFTQDGGYIKFQITDAFDRVSLCIENSGNGISPDDLPMIFDKFYKSDKSRSHDKNGMGLGLYLVKTIVKLHGGDISVSSAVSGATRFELYIPKPDLNKKTTTETVIKLSSNVDIQDVE